MNSCISIKTYNVLPSIPVIFPTHELFSLSQPPSAIKWNRDERTSLFHFTAVTRLRDVRHFAESTAVKLRIRLESEHLQLSLWQTTKANPYLVHTAVTRDMRNRCVCVCSQTVNSGVATPVETLDDITAGRSS